MVPFKRKFFKQVEFMEKFIYQTDHKIDTGHVRRFMKGEVPLNLIIYIANDNYFKRS